MLTQGMPVLSHDYADCKPRPGRLEGNMYPLAASRVDEWSMLSGDSDAVGSIEYGPGYYELYEFDWSDMIEILAYSGPEANAAIRVEDDRGFISVVFYESLEVAKVDFEWAVNYYAELDRYDREQNGEDDDYYEDSDLDVGD